MKKLYTFYAGTLLAGYLLFLLLQLPAAMALRVIQGLAPESAITFQQLQGSAWRGSATRVGTGRVTLASLNWEIRVLPLLLGRIEYRIEASADSLSLEGNIGTGLFSDPYLEDMRGRISSDQAGELAQLPFVKTDGVLEIGLEYLAVKRRFPTRVQGELLWREARITAPYQIALGNILFAPGMTDETLVVAISSQGGTTRIDGSFALDPQGAYQIQGTITPAPDMDHNLVSMLNSMGRRDADGSIAIRYTGRYNR